MSHAVKSMNNMVKLGSTAAAFVAAGVVARTINTHQRSQRRLRRGENIEFGSVHSTPTSVAATDGVTLNVEVDEGPAGPTIVFVHGWTCNLDTWHYQRAALRGQARMVFFDQRSHGQSGRSYDHNSSIDQLAEDLRVVLETFAPTGDIILVGHSMGGMSIMGLADAHPHLFGTRVTGVVLISTSAGHLMKGNSSLRRILPIVSRLSPLLDQGRAFNSYSVIRRWGLGPNAQERHVDMTNEMILSTPTHVLIDFQRNFVALDRYRSLAAIGRAETVVVCGTKDILTPIRHARRLVEQIPGAQLVAVENAGHMVMFEDHDDVTEVISDLYGRLS